MNKAAFTLAETLLTLVIVGIVATMTVPAVMHHIEKVSLHTAFLKAYSTAEQAHKVMMRNNGGSLNGADFLPDNSPYFRGRPFIADAFNAQFRCSPLPLIKCWHEKWKTANGVTLSTNWGGFTTHDGMLWMYDYDGNENCTSTTKCFMLSVDVNGFKKPNVIGRDVFHLIFFAERILPRGAPGTDVENTLCASTSGGYGNSCAFYELTNKPKVVYLKNY